MGKGEISSKVETHGKSVVIVKSGGNWADEKVGTLRAALRWRQSDLGPAIRNRNRFV